MGPYITEKGTPVAEMWEQEFGHLDKKKHMQVMECVGWVGAVGLNPKTGTC